MKFRIATYNLFEGATATYNRLAEFVRKAEVDVLCLQEINGWEANDYERMRDFADKAIFATYQFGNSNTEYKLATFSKERFVSSTVYIEGFWHCAVVTQITVDGQTLTIVNVHLDPWQEAARVREIERILNKLDLTKPTIVTGDFNCLSRADNYGPEVLQALQAKGITKFGRDALEFGVTDRLTQAGMVDLAAALNNTEVTVPTPSAIDKAHEVPVRLDYIFATPDVARWARGIEVPRTSFTDIISDHYPVIVTLDTAAVAPEPQQAQAQAATETSPADPPKDSIDDDGTLIIQH